MGGKSKSSTNQVSNFSEVNTTLGLTDNRAISEGGLIGGSTTIASGGDVSGVTINTLDLGAIDRAFESVNEAINASGAVIDNSTGRALNLAQENTALALDANSQALAGSLSLAGRVNSDSLSFSNNVLNANTNLVDDVLAGALDLIRTDRAESLTTTRTALNSINSNLNTALDFARDAGQADGGTSERIATAALMVGGAVAAVFALRG